MKDKNIKKEKKESKEEKRHLQNRRKLLASLIKRQERVLTELYEELTEIEKGLK